MRWTLALLSEDPRSLAQMKRSSPTGGARQTVIVAIAIALALLVGPTLALAAPPVVSTAQPLRPAAAVTSTIVASGEGAPTSPEKTYASREARAKGLENFKGGDTTVVIGGSALVIILVVLLILVIL